MNHSAKLRQHVLDLLRGGHAHAGLERALGGMPAALRGKKPRAAAHTAWQLLEHIRIAQRDILDFTLDSKHVSPAWPAGYWPATAAPPTAKAWNMSCAAVKADLIAMEALVLNEETDLLAPLPHDPAKTVLREALLLADHNAYHAGQLVALRKTLGAWKAG